MNTKALIYILGSLLSLGVISVQGQVAVDHNVATSAQAAVQKLGLEMMKGNFKFGQDRIYPRWKRRLAKRVGSMEKLEAQGIDSLISLVSARGLSIFYKLHRKGLNTVCIPRSVENDIASTMVSFGFNSSLDFTIQMLDRTRQAAQSADQFALVEVLGEKARWLALQAGIAVCADAVLIPEIPCDMNTVAESLRQKMTPSRRHGLVVVAKGASIIAEPDQGSVSNSSFKASLSPLATGGASSHVIERSGQAANAVANSLQLLMAEEAYPLTLGNWARGGTPTAVDRQLGLAYGAGAVRALAADKKGVMVAFHPPDIEFVPLIEAINKVRTVPPESEMMRIARSLGICLGDEL